METGLSNISFLDGDRFYYIHLMHEEERKYVYCCHKIPLAGLVHKILQCLKLPHTDLELVLNFV